MTDSAPDLVLRGGTVVDGTGGPALRADVAVRAERIAEVGACRVRGAREVDVGGRVVAPGFIDIHTHYDAQLCWDPLATPSPLHGVTTVCTGNCSLSLAPTRVKDQRRLVGMFQTIEDIRAETFAAGVDWGWESFDEYLASLAGNLGVNLIPLVGHSALRLYVMGDAAQQRTASDAELQQMCEVLAESVRAGAKGFSTSYLDVDEDLRPVPSRYSDLRERVALARAAREAGGAVMEAVPVAGDPEQTESCIRELGEISRESGLLCTLQPIIFFPLQPDLWQQTLGWLEEEAESGARVYGQSPPAPMHFNLRLDETFFTFYLLPSWGDVMRRPASERAPLLADPARRAGLVAEGEQGLSLFLPHAAVGETCSPENEPLRGRKLVEIAAEWGRSPVDALIEISLRDELHTEFTIETEMHRPDEVRHAILKHPLVLVGASDAGAHLSQFCGAGDPCYLLAETVRRCGVMSLEEAVHRLTGQPADLFELQERGRVEPGYAADLVVFDPEAVDMGPEVFTRDLPGGATRYLRTPVGIDRVYVAGETIVEGGRYTEARPGRVV